MTYSKGERKEIGRELNRFSQDGSLEKGPQTGKSHGLSITEQRAETRGERDREHRERERGAVIYY